jgi:Thiamine monophosphate synthase
LVQAFISSSFITPQWLSIKSETTTRASLLPYHDNQLKYHCIHVSTSGDSESKLFLSGAMSTTEEDPDEKIQCRRRYLCLITESNACDNMQEVRRTIETLKSALGTHNDHAIDFISIRVNPLPIDPSVQEPTTNNSHNEAFRQRLNYLASEIMALKRQHQGHPLYNEYDVVMNDINNLQTAIESNVDGIHVKEKDVAQIPYIRSVFQGMNRTKPVVIGISAHSASVALHHFQMYRPNYIFVGTCYMTQSHPEKSIQDLEGPELPGVVKRLILQHKSSKHADPELDQISFPPIILAIGGIEKNNCHEPLAYGADGVAVIRSVMQSADPALAVKEIKHPCTELHQIIEKLMWSN